MQNEHKFSYAFSICVIASLVATFSAFSCEVCKFEKHYSGLTIFI